MKATAGIDDATAEAFRRNGVVHLEGAFTEQIDMLRAGVERNMRSPGPCCMSGRRTVRCVPPCVAEA